MDATTIERRNNAVLQVREIKKTLGSRLNKIGVIKTGDAWELCKHCKILVSYQSFATHFKTLMLQLNALGYADHVGKGTWIVYRQGAANLAI